jgi:hypothetical protein
MNPIQKAWSIVRANWQAYIIINVLYYGIVAAAMIYVGFNPDLQKSLMEIVGQGFIEGPLATVGEAYSGGKVLEAIGLTFIVNLLAGSFLYITLPSLFIPFLGLAMGVVRAILWGLLLSPTNPDLRMIMIPHFLTLILEGQAYIIALLAAYVHGKSFLMPRRSGIEASGVKAYLQGYLLGLKQTAWLYVLVILLLAMAAIYEVLEVIFLVPLLQ